MTSVPRARDAIDAVLRAKRWRANRSQRRVTSSGQPAERTTPEGLVEGSPATSHGSGRTGCARLRGNSGDVAIDAVFSQPGAPERVLDAVGAHASTIGVPPSHVPFSASWAGAGTNS